MRRSFRWVVAVLCLQGGWCASSRADSFTTNIISGVSTNAGTYFILGDTGSMNYLEINNGGSLGCNYAVIGNNPPASNNTALVTDPGSVWAAMGGIFIGEESVGNSLIVSNGGQLISTGISDLGDGKGADNNLVLLTGTNSQWSNSGSLAIGWQGSSNQVQVLGGAQFQILGYNSLWLGTQIASNNILVVDGAGSRLTDGGTLGIGGGGRGDQFRLSGGASAICSGAGVSGTGNVIVVTGSNTAWNINGEFDLGTFGPGTSNQLTISAGAVVSNATLTVGDPTSPNNTVIVDGAGTVWYNRAFYFAGSSNNTFLVTNGATIYSSSIVDIGDGRAANNNAVVLTGTNTIWNNSGSLAVGLNGGSGNQLQILNGAQFLGNTFIVLGAGYSNNSLIVTGPNSLLTSSGSLYVGGDGPGNQLILSNGANFICAGAGVGNSNNVVLITGSNTVWNNNGTLEFGEYGGSSNQLVISAGAVVSNGGCTITTSSNSILVDGTGTTWNTGWVSITEYTSGNQLVVTNGATVNSLGIQEGIGGGLNCQMIITGSNTICNASTVNVGSEPFFGGVSFPTALLIENGGQLLGNVYASIDAYGEGYTAVVTDPGSRWAGIGQLVIGVSNTGSHLLISNSAVVQASQAIVGIPSIAPSNTVTIVNGGVFIVTNSPGNAPLTLPYGEFFLSDGTVIGNNITISSPSEITGCGTIVGNINNSGTLAVTCPGGTLTVDGIVTNNASIIATNGADLEFLGPVVNNGTIDLVNGFGHFLGGFLNKGVYRDAATVLKTPVLNFNVVGIAISFASVSGKTYAVEYTDGMAPTNWAVLFGGITGTGGTMQFTDTNAVSLTQRFYRVHLTLP